MLWQVDMVLDKLKEDRKIAAATHNIIAYRCDDDDYDSIGEWAYRCENYDNCDDNEHNNDEDDQGLARVLTVTGKNFF